VLDADTYRTDLELRLISLALKGRSIDLSLASRFSDFRCVPSIDAVRFSRQHFSNMADLADVVCCWGRSRPRGYERRLRN
jgi:hypothetical protein